MNLVILIGLVVTAATIVPVLAQLKSHPRGLVILFVAETWERFSYYGMRGLLIFYLTQHFLLPDAQAQSRFAAYSTLASLMPLVGAAVADRLLGTRKAVAFGALMLVAGHLTMAAEGPAAHNVITYAGARYEVTATGRMVDRQARVIIAGQPHAFHATPDGGLAIEGLAPGSPVPSVLPKGAYSVTREGASALHETLLFTALSLIVMGVGFLKTSPLVAQLYGKADPRRDGGFTLFYYGVNLGAFWAGILCGWLGTYVGWWAGFGLAAVGMSAGYVVFVLGKPLLEGHGEPPDPVRLAKPIAGPVNLEAITYAAALVGVVALTFLMRGSGMVASLLGVGSVLSIGYLVWYMVTKCSPAERKHIGLAMILMSGSVVFWTLFNQAGSSLSLFAERNTALDLVAAPIRLRLFGHEVFAGTAAMLDAARLAPGQVWWLDMGFTAPQTQSLNPGFILIFAPLFAGLWAFLGRRGRDPSPMVKFGVALVQIGVGFLVLVWGARFADPSYRVPLYFLVLAYLLHTTGELCLSPVGLSVVSRLAPGPILASLMALSSLSGSWAAFIGGRIAALASTETIGGQVLDPSKSLAAAITVFTWIGAAGIAAGALFLALAPVLRPWGAPIAEPALSPTGAPPAEPELAAAG